MIAPPRRVGFSAVGIADLGLMSCERGKSAAQRAAGINNAVMNCEIKATLLEGGVVIATCNVIPGNRAREWGTSDDLEQPVFPGCVPTRIEITVPT